MSLLKMISSPYSILRNLRVCCHYTLHLGNSLQVSGCSIKLFTSLGCSFTGLIPPESVRDSLYLANIGNGLLKHVFTNCRCFDLLHLTADFKAFLLFLKEAFS